MSDDSQKPDNSLDLDTTAERRHEAAHEALLRYNENPTPFRDIKSAVLTYLVKMEIPACERAEAELDPVKRAMLIAMSASAGSLVNQDPERGDTRLAIIAAVKRKYPGTPDCIIEKALKFLARDGKVYCENPTNLPFRGDEVWRIQHESDQAHGLPAQAGSDAARGNGAPKRKRKRTQSEGLTPPQKKLFDYLHAGHLQKEAANMTALLSLGTSVGVA